MDQINGSNEFDIEERCSNSVKHSVNFKNHKSLSPVLHSIQVRKLTVSYRESQNIVTILNRLTLNVRLNSVYALLGPSGCGKTTLIRTILGLVKPESGQIRLFHRRLDSKNKHCLEIPGKDVGYMPQDYCLYNDLTVLEQLNYHQALHNVSICKFSTFKLIETLELENQINQLVGTLSGGQQRRVSFACAIVHKPRLLILDEPTVGVDPLLRRRLWQVLIDYVDNFKSSVLITTHYIEEARKANFIGFMRRGFLLAEDHPEKLIERYKVKNLEDVFFKLCVKQKKSKLWKRTFSKSDAVNARKRLDQQLSQFESNSKSAEVQIDIHALNQLLKEEAIRKVNEFQAHKAAIDLKKTRNDEKKKTIDNLLETRQSGLLIQIFYWFFRLFVVVKRIFKQTKRQKSALVAQFVLPLISMLLFNFCVGETPKDVRIAIVNEEESPYLSTVFLSKLNPRIINPLNFATFGQALESVKRTESLAVLRIPKNFSNALIERAQYQADNTNDEITNDTLIQSTMVLNADLTNKVLLVTIQRTLDLSLQKFLNTLLVDLGYKSNLLTIPFRLEESIYGSFYSVANDDNYYALKDYGLSGILIILNYSMAFSLTVLVLAEEKREQFFERNVVIGISSTVIILGHLVVRILLCNLNVALLLYLTTELFYAPIRVKMHWPYALLMIQSMVGLAHGMLISAICNDFFMSAVLSNGVLLMMFILSGVLWSTESLPTYLRFISSVQPTTSASESLRWMLSRGQDINDPKVYNSFLISGVYFCVFFFLAALLFRKKH